MKTEKTSHRADSSRAKPESGWRDPQFSDRTAQTPAKKSGTHLVQPQEQLAINDSVYTTLVSLVHLPSPIIFSTSQLTP